MCMPEARRLICMHACTHETSACLDFSCHLFIPTHCAPSSTPLGICVYALVVTHQLHFLDYGKETHIFVKGRSGSSSHFGSDAVHSGAGQVDAQAFAAELRRRGTFER